MRIALLSDVHANLPALEAALQEIGKLGCDLVIHTGDLIAIGPFPSECIQLAMTVKDLYALIGNHEQYLLHGIPEPRPASMSEEEREHQRWVAATIKDSEKRWIEKLPYQITFEINRLKIVFLHCLLQEDNSGFSMPKEITARSLDEYFRRVDANLICYGHTHRQSIIKGKKEYINPGALGCHPLSMAGFFLINISKNGFEIEKHQAEYNGDKVLEEMKKRSVPARETINQIFYQVK